MNKRQSVLHFKELVRHVDGGCPEIYINLINWHYEVGPLVTDLLDQAGYVPDSLGPQRVYRKGE